MVAVREIDLTALGVHLPQSRVGMVVLQPFLRLTEFEPFKIRAASRPQQLAAIAKTLQVSRARDHGEPVTHFTVFPELTIPAPDGVALIEEALGSADWPVSSF